MRYRQRGHAGEVTYKHAQHAAALFGISAEDDPLWSQTTYIRTLLDYYGVGASNNEQPFHSWKTLPDLALLAIKWRMHVVGLLRYCPSSGFQVTYRQKIRQVVWIVVRMSCTHTVLSLDRRSS